IQNLPSPPALPIIGHLQLLGSILPKSFQTLARCYGPLIANVAKEIYKIHNLNFAYRPKFGSSDYSIYKGSSFIMAPYGDYWHFMKKLCMTRLLAVPQLSHTIDIHEEQVEKLVERITKFLREGKPRDLRGELTTLTNNVICIMVMSTRCLRSENEAVEILEISVGDVLGPLKILDFSRNNKRFVRVMEQFDRLLERIMKEHEAKVMNGGITDQKNDLMDILIETQRDPSAEVKISRQDIKSFLLDIFLVGTDTSSATMQWAMGELINKPQALNKLREEINEVVKPNRLVKESDIPNLPYLRVVIRETLRLHPLGPFIIRECAKDCKVNGSFVKGKSCVLINVGKSRVLINVYAMMRDLEKLDEKISEHQMEFKGQNFRYIPFGSGRRGCPGASLALLVMHTTIAALVQRFDWKVKGRENVDLSLGSGFGAEMEKPLVCYPITCLT
ncbi:hypothetical protein ACB092_11G027200, partial [Castanea dentata]